MGKRKENQRSCLTEFWVCLLNARITIQFCSLLRVIVRERCGVFLFNMESRVEKKKKKKKTKCFQQRESQKNFLRFQTHHPQSSRIQNRSVQPFRQRMAVYLHL